MVGQRQQAIMAYQSQANGTAERTVQTLTRSIKITTLEATLPVVNTRRRGSGPRRWRYHIQQHYQRVRAQLDKNLRAASQARILAHNEGVVDHKTEPGTQVWLYLDRVKDGYAKKLAHLWHGPFRVLELMGEHAACLKIRGTEYELFPVVHLSNSRGL
ncbi:unnamed protein product [Peronospora belbahrii]|uniref:Reverse transcriptase n=1 Tax=Peronospora belbahrii TaxID=622444 RepID=A0ABN8CSG6_9STRA|nr:unnamed protein product [Peronospora belbahrii]